MTTYYIVATVYFSILGMGLIGIIYEMYKDKGRGSGYASRINKERKFRNKNK